jgi:hypothetical protein
MYYYYPTSYLTISLDLARSTKLVQTRQLYIFILFELNSPKIKTTQRLIHSLPNHNISINICFLFILNNMKRSTSGNNRGVSRAVFEARQSTQTHFRCELCKQNIRGKARFDTHVTSIPHILKVQTDIIERERIEYRETQNLQTASINVSVGHTLMHGDDDDDLNPLDDDPDKPLPPDLLTSPSPAVTFSPSVRDNLLSLGYPEPISAVAIGVPSEFPNSTGLDSPPTIGTPATTESSYVPGVISPLPPEIIARCNQRILTPFECSAIDLHNILDESGAPIGLFDKLFRWARKSSLEHCFDFQQHSTQQRKGFMNSLITMFKPVEPESTTVSMEMPIFAKQFTSGNIHITKETTSTAA